METDGQVTARDHRLRGAATIVYEPLDPSPAREVAYLPSAYADSLLGWADACGLDRDWREGTSETGRDTVWDIERFARRGLARLIVKTIGTDMTTPLAHDALQSHPCCQLDLPMSDPGLDHAIAAAREQGWFLCGWLPGFTGGDVLRMQRVDVPATDLAPAVVNPTAQALLEYMRSELALT